VPPVKKTEGTWNYCGGWGITLQGCPPSALSINKPMKVSGLFFIVVVQTTLNLIVTNFLDCKARGAKTARFVFLLNCELGHAPIHRIKLLKKQVVILIPKLYTNHEKSQKDVELTSFCDFLIKVGN